MLPVRIVEVDVTHDMATGGEDDDPGARRGGELRCQQPSEFEVAEMICSQLYFEAVLSAAERREHDARVVHQDIDDGRGVADLRGRGSPAGQPGQIELPP